jgi:hypothetical protein
MSAGSPDVLRLHTDLERLYAAVAHWSDSRWRARAGDGRSRADVLFALILDLTELAARAGCGAPPGARPARLGSHVLADQLAVVGAELVAAPRTDAVVADAAAAVAATRWLLLR